MRSISIAKITPAATIITVSLAFRRKRKILSKNTINSSIYLTSKYHKLISEYHMPYVNAVLNSTAIIAAEMVNDNFLLSPPFAYQQINAKSGETMVNPTQIMAYDFGKKPAMNFEYK